MYHIKQIDDYYYLYKYNAYYIENFHLNLDWINLDIKTFDIQIIDASPTTSIVRSLNKEALNKLTEILNFKERTLPLVFSHDSSLKAIKYRLEDKYFLLFEGYYTGKCGGIFMPVLNKFCIDLNKLKHKYIIENNQLFFKSSYTDDFDDTINYLNSHFSLYQLKE